MSKNENDLIKTTIHLHSEKSDNYEKGMGLELSDSALDNFVYAAYEISLKVEVNRKTGNCVCYAIACNENETKLEKPISI